MSKQTAVDYLVEQFARYYSIHQLDEEIEQAKAMEKEQIINTFKQAQVLMVMDSTKRAEQYYNKTYS